MARKLTTQMAAAVVARSVRPALLISLNFASGQLNLWTGYGNLTYNGIVFTGTGTLLSIDQIPETSDGSAASIKLTLSGISTAAIALAVGQQYQGGLAQIWLACFDLNLNTLITNPYMIFGGSMDVMTIQDGTKSASISLTCESRLIELDRPRERRYSQFDQQIDFPNDTGLNFVNGLQDLQIYWGDPNGPISAYPGAGGIGPLNVP
jgi:hypothetical protein